MPSTNSEYGSSYLAVCHVTFFLLYSSKTSIHVNISLLFDQFISDIQEIIDIEWMFELICIFSCQ